MPEFSTSLGFQRHLKQMLDAILVSTFQRLHGAKERENFFSGEQGGLMIGFRFGMGMVSILAERR